MKYGVIYLDPPWYFKNWSKKGEKKNPNQHYPCMKHEELMKLPVPDFAAKQCLMFMWILDTHLESALVLIRHFGFKYTSFGFIWDKDEFGMGYWTRKGGEVCLLAKKGKPKRKAKDVRQWIRSPTRDHSRKPIIHNRIERLADGPYLEMFARQRRPGWDAWGNEVDKFTTEVL